MKPRNIFFLALFISASQLLFAQHYSAMKDSLKKYEGRFFVGGYLGIGSPRKNGRTIEKIELNAGYKELVFTARFYRNWENYPVKHIYEDALMAGWKKKFWNGFSSTLSGGYADLAFENTIVEGTVLNVPENFHKRSGLVLEEKLGYNFHWWNSAPSIWGIAANYYCVFNSEKTIQGWTVGLDFTLDDMYWKNPNYKTKRKHPPLGPPKRPGQKYVVPYKFRVRTNLITGMFFSPHLDFEYKYNGNWAWGVGVFMRPDNNFNAGILRLFDNPDMQLHGGGGYIDWVYFQPIWKNDHYWTFGLRTGYRNLSGVCAIGGNIYEPDYYVTRTRQDIVSDIRISFVMPPKNSKWAIDWYISGGARTSFYTTKFPPGNPYWDPSASFTQPKNGCYVLPEITGGFEIGFGW